MLFLFLLPKTKNCVFVSAYHSFTKFSLYSGDYRVNLNRLASKIWNFRSSIQLFDSICPNDTGIFFSLAYCKRSWHLQQHEIKADELHGFDCHTSQWEEGAHKRKQILKNSRSQAIAVVHALTNNIIRIFISDECLFSIENISILIILYITKT